ncbi:hypothetical protein TRVL_08658 [Trypanosoma vivax]|nr:hypothetical protein TRVL_08658 [Trypanosoma vivax]
MTFITAPHEVATAVTLEQQAAVSCRTKNARVSGTRHACTGARSVGGSRRLDTKEQIKAGAEREVSTAEQVKQTGKGTKETHLCVSMPPHGRVSRHLTVPIVRQPTSNRRRQHSRRGVQQS